MWALFMTDGCKPDVAVLAQYFPHNYRVENQAGEKRMGCDCSPPQITATGNAGRTRTFRLLDITIFRWVATTCSSEQQGL